MEDLVITNNPGLQVTSSTLPSLTQKNVKLANQAHPVTGIVFDQRGFPIFDNVAKFDTKIASELAVIDNPKIHMKAATQILRQEIEAGRLNSNMFTNEQLTSIFTGEAIIPEFTWHHHQDVGRMQLVPKGIHSQTGHVGGMNMMLRK